MPNPYLTRALAEQQAHTSEDGYTASTVKDLQVEIDKRNDGREDDAKIPRTGIKAELVAALVADDNA